VGVLADRARWRGGEEHLPHGGVQPVGAEHEVVATGGGVAEAHGDAAVVGVDGLWGAAPSDRRVDGSQQHLVQLRPRQGQTGADTGPQVLDVEVEEQAPAVIGEALPLDAYRALGHLRAEAQPVEGAHGVARQEDPGAFGAGRRGVFDDVHRRAPAAQRAGGGQPGDARADDKDSHAVTPHDFASVVVEVDWPARPMTAPAGDGYADPDRPMPRHRSTGGPTGVHGCRLTAAAIRPGWTSKPRSCCAPLVTFVVAPEPSAGGRAGTGVRVSR
jgi:hypothetical protein